MYSPRRSLDESVSPTPASSSSEPRRKTVSFTELPLLQPSRFGPVPSYKNGNMPPPRASSLAAKHRRRESDQFVLVRRAAPSNNQSHPVTTLSTPARPHTPVHNILDIVASSPWARPDGSKDDTRPSALVSVASGNFGSALATPPVDQPILLPLAPSSVPPSPASSTASFFSDTNVQYSPLPSPAASFYDLPPPSPITPKPAFSPALASSLLLYCATGTIVQEAATKNSVLFFTIDLLVYYTLFIGALAVFGWSWLFTWHTALYIVVLIDITSLRERHLLEFGADPEEDLQRLARAAGSDSDSDIGVTVEAKLERRRRIERPPWTPVPYLILTGTLFLAILHALVVARVLLLPAGFGYAWFNFSTVLFWQAASFLLEQHFPQCLLYSRSKVLFRKNEVESIVGRQALHRLVPPALLAITYYTLCTFYPSA